MGDDFTIYVDVGGGEPWLAYAPGGELAAGAEFHAPRATPAMPEIARDKGRGR